MKLQIKNRTDFKTPKNRLNTTITGNDFLSYEFKIAALEEIFNKTLTFIIISDNEGRILLSNPSCSRIFSSLPANLKKVLKRVLPSDRRKVFNTIKTVFLVPQAVTFVQYQFLDRNNHYIHLETIVQNISIKDNTFILLRTQEITHHKQIEQELLTKNKEIIEKEKALKEKNTAMKEIIKQIDKEKEQVEFQLYSNINKLINPVLQTLYEKASETDKLLVNFIKNCLHNITSPFINAFEKKFSALTPREIEISKMIINGFSSKDIASTLAISLLTVHKFRQQIRKKLGLNNKKINLVSYLKSLEVKE